MTTTLTMNRPCSRCPRIDQKEITQAELIELAKIGKQLDDAAPPAMVITVHGKVVVTFPHLCTPCQEIVKEYLGNAGKVVDKLSAKRVVTPGVRKAKGADPTSALASAAPPAQAPAAETPSKAPSAPGTGKTSHKGT